MDNGSNKETVVGYVLQTKDYSMFKLLDGNRPVLERRKARIKKSVTENGQLFSPIIVNEKMEIIDGQGRFEVFKEKKLPINYIMKEGLTLKDCVVFNSTSTSWTTQDYIDSYVAQGNENYIRLNSLVKTHKEAPIGAIVFAAVGISGKAHHGEKNDIKSGKMIVSEAAFLKADRRLHYAERFLVNFERGDGNKGYLMDAAMFCYDIEGVDRERLVEKWNKYGNIKSVRTPAITIRDAVAALEKAYNFKTQVNNVMYFEAEYDKHCREQNASYASRWAEKLNG